MRKIAFFQLEDWEREFLVTRGKTDGLDAQVVLGSDILRPETVGQAADAEIISVFVDSAVTKEILAKFSNLKMIATRSTGYDHIDLNACRERGIVVSNVPSYGENTVAEYAFALILTLSRKVYDSYDRIRETGSFNLDGLRGFDLKGKTLGVVGTGRIGKNVIRIAKGFEMEVIAYDPYPDNEAAETLGFRYVLLEELLAQSKIVSLHVPLLPETTHLINDKSLELMASDAYLVNTARGGIVDTQALVRAIKTGQLAGAALDVLEEEGTVKDELSFLTSEAPAKNPDLKTVLANHVLIDLPNVIVTPHNAFNTKEALERIMDTTVDNIKNYIAGQPTAVVPKHE